MEKFVYYSSLDTMGKGQPYLFVDTIELDGRWRDTQQCTLSGEQVKWVEQGTWLWARKAQKDGFHL